MSLIQIALAGLAPIILIGLLTWLASVKMRDVSLVDRVWSICIGMAALVYFVLLPPSGGRGACMLVLVAAWALRLSAFITARNMGHGEERRYQAIRERNQPNFAFKSLYLVFALQAMLSWVVSAPFLAGMNSTAPVGAFDIVGVLLTAFGIVFEAVGDQQLHNFKKDPANKGKVMDKGLWRYTRHPNYFGEFSTWWGFWVIAMSGAGMSGAWSIVSPLLMSVLLLKVSGVTLQEKDIGDRRPGYREYIERTNAFFPAPPHKPRAK